MGNLDTRRNAQDPGGLGTVLGDSIRQGPQSNFLKAIVLDVLIDPQQLKNSERNPFEGLGNNIKNVSYVENAPRNSIIAKLISNNSAKKDSNIMICYPFYPPHLAMPINPGETVWLISDSSTGDAPLFYWMHRVVEPDFVDDVNYTHSDRKFQSIRRGTAERAGATESDTSSVNLLIFPNGAGTRDSTTLPGNQDAFDILVEQSFAFSQCVKEAIPKYSKRPGDLVLQGSNNTLISLGYARNSSGENTSAIESVPETSRLKTGTIDIVVGRGVDSTTSPFIATNSREFEENQKIANGNNSFTVNPIEGDPNYASDLSRIILTMNDDVDTKFNLTPYAGTTPTAPAPSAPSIVLKTDNMRLVTRETGNIRLQKEGSSDNSGVLQIESNGNVVIDGTKIIIGDGREAQTQIGDGATEHLILGDLFLTAFNDFLTQLSTATGNLGIPLAPINAAATTLSSRISAGEFTSKVATVK